MAANACIIEADGSPFLVASERVTRVESCGFLASSGSGYPGQSCNYHNVDCNLFLTNLRMVVIPKEPTTQFRSFVLPLWLITDEKIVEPHFGPVRVEGRVVPIPGLGLPSQARFALVFSNRAVADDFMEEFDPIIESARRCQVLGGPESVAHHSVCVGPSGNCPVDYVRLRSDRVLMDPNDPSMLILPATISRSASPEPVNPSDIGLSVQGGAPISAGSDEPMRLGRPDRNGYQRFV